MSRQAMTALRRLADPRLRPVWYGAAAAVALAAVVMTGAILWLVAPWWHLAIATAAGGAYLALWQRGTFDRHEGTRRRGGLTPDEREAVREALDAAERHSQDRLMGRQPETNLLAARARADARAEVAADAAFAHSAMWQPRGSEAGTPMAAVAARYEPHREPRFEPGAPGVPDYDRRFWGEYYGQPGEPGDPGNGVPVVEVTDDPAGRHERPRAYLVNADPYCSRCGRYGHWTGQQHCADAVVDELLARRRDGHVAAAIAGHLRDAGLKVYACEDDAVDSIMMRALNGPPAIEAARNE